MANFDLQEKIRSVIDLIRLKLANLDENDLNKDEIFLGFAAGDLTDCGLSQSNLYKVLNYLKKAEIIKNIEVNDTEKIEAPNNDNPEHWRQLYKKLYPAIYYIKIDKNFNELSKIYLNNPKKLLLNNPELKTSINSLTIVAPKPISQYCSFKLIINSNYNKPIKVSRKTKSWNFLFNVAEKKPMESEANKSYSDYINGSRNLIVQKGYQQTKILATESRYVVPNIEIKIITEKAYKIHLNKQGKA